MTDPERDSLNAGGAEIDAANEKSMLPARGGGCGRAGCGFVIGVLGSALIMIVLLAAVITRGHPLTYASRLISGATTVPTQPAATSVVRAVAARTSTTPTRGAALGATATPPPSATPTFIPVPTAVPTQTPTATPTPTPTPIIALRQVNELGRYESMQFVIQTVVDLAREPSNFWERICGSDQLLLVAGGEVIAGFDLSKVGPGDLRVSGKSLKLVLPPPEVFSYFVREDQTYVYLRNTGLLCKPSQDLETQARRQAEQRLLDYALGQGILARAEKAGVAQLEAFFRDLGFEQIELVVKGQSPGYD